MGESNTQLQLATSGVSLSMRVLLVCQHQPSFLVSPWVMAVIFLLQPK